MTRPSVFVFAYNQVGYQCLKCLFDQNAKVKWVSTYRDRKDENIWFDSVAELALSKGAEVFFDMDLKDPSVIDFIKSLSPDLMFSFYYRHIIPKEVLAIPPLGAFNVHGALLPKYRGGSPTHWAIINGEKETGVTLHRMAEKLDQGAIVGQRAVPIGPEETSVQVIRKVALEAYGLLKDYLPALESGKAKEFPQDDSKATYFKSRHPKDGIVDWKKRASDIYNLVRAVTHPYPGAFTYFNKKKFLIWSCGGGEDPF